MITKTYTELNSELTSINARVDELNKQLTELSNHKEELISQIQLRKQQLIENYIQLVNQLLETQKEMMEMGIDPTTIDMTKDKEIMTESVMADEHEVVDTPMEDDAQGEVIHVEEQQEEAIGDKGDITNHTSLEDYYNSINISDDELAEILSTGRKNTQLLTPYYYVWGLRKGEFELICSVPDYKTTSHQLNKSFMELTHSPNETMLLGNECYRDSYPNPDEGKVYSAYGIAPTLTSSHCDMIVQIGRNPYVAPAA